MHDENRISLCKYRIDKARECLRSAVVLKKNEDFSAAANRSYYAMFHSIRAIMALDGEDRRKHSGVVSYFQEKYIKNNVFDKSLSYIIKNAFQIRQESDYEDFCIISKSEVDEQIENANILLREIECYIKNTIGNK